MGNIYAGYLIGKNSAVQAHRVLHFDTAHLFSCRLTDWEQSWGDWSARVYIVLMNGTIYTNKRGIC